MNRVLSILVLAAVLGALVGRIAVARAADAPLMSDAIAAEVVADLLNDCHTFGGMATKPADRTVVCTKGQHTVVIDVDPHQQSLRLRLQSTASRDDVFKALQRVCLASGIERMSTLADDKEGVIHCYLHHAVAPGWRHLAITVADGSGGARATMEFSE